MIFQIHRLEYGKRLFVPRHCCSWLRAARSTTFKINDRLKTDSQIISISQPQQINSANNRVGLLFCGSHTWHLYEESVWVDQLVTWCLLLMMKMSAVNRRVSALLQQSCSILTEKRLFPDSGYMLLLRIYIMLLSMNHRIVRTQDQWATDEGQPVLVTHRPTAFAF